MEEEEQVLGQRERAKDVYDSESVLRERAHPVEMRFLCNKRMQKGRRWILEREIESERK